LRRRKGGIIYVKKEFYNLELFGWLHKSGEDQTPYQKPIPIDASLLCGRLAISLKETKSLSLMGKVFLETEKR
jgi:hypothetical protein